MRSPVRSHETAAVVFAVVAVLEAFGAEGAVRIPRALVAAPPLVTRISRSTGPLAGGTAVTITGSNFTGVTGVAFGANAGTGVSCATVNTCTVTSPAGTGTVSIRVTNASGTSADTAADDFTYTAQATACTTFAPAANVTADTTPNSVAVGDFNGDGFPDLAVANQSSNDVSVLLGTGIGTFGASTNFAVGVFPRSVAIGDFNGDGIRDLVVVNNTSNNVSILLGTGIGTFGAATNFTTGTGPNAVAIGDFNGDGINDLAVTNNDSNDVSILLGTGTGAFSAPTSFPVGSFPRSVAIGDFNGDGKSDLAVANAISNNVSILLGTGTGTFGAATNIVTGTNPSAVAIGDFNGDGISDLAVANLTSNNVSILLGTGTGTFGAPTNVTVGTNPASVAIGDFNGDGKSDLAVGNENSSNVSILLGTGTGTFGAPANLTAGLRPESVAIGDFNGDGKSDLAVANLTTSNVSILINSTSPGTLALSSATYTVNEGAGTATITVNRGAGSDCTVTVNYATSDGSATAGSDYTATSGTLTFGSGVTTQSFTVPIIEDNLYEGDETFNVTITAPTGGATLGAQTSAVVTIVDDETQPTLSIGNVSLNEGDSGTTPFTFPVTLSGPSAATVTVSFATANGTAVAPGDYASNSGVLTFTPGVTSQNVVVQVAGDTTLEPNETFTVTLSSASNATIAAGTGTGTIQNDDAGMSDLSITKTASGVAFATQTLTYNIAVTNAGPNDATTVTVTDVLPAGVTFVSAVPTQGSCSGATTITCNLGALANGGSASIALRVTPSGAGPFSNTASVSAAPQADPNSANNQSTANVTVAPASNIPALGGAMKMLLVLMTGMLGLLLTRTD